MRRTFLSELGSLFSVHIRVFGVWQKQEVDGAKFVVVEMLCFCGYQQDSVDVGQVMQFSRTREGECAIPARQKSKQSSAKRFKFATSRTRILELLIVGQRST